MLDLLRDYLKCAEHIAHDLCVQFGVVDLLASVNMGAVPRRGICNSFGGGEYYFHGSGCRVTAAEIEIDFDFGPNSSVPGADLWKLYNFAMTHSDDYPWLTSRGALESEAKKLIERGMLRRIDLPPSPHLVCLA